MDYNVIIKLIACNYKTNSFFGSIALINYLFGTILKNIKICHNIKLKIRHINI